jgi:exonuclease III
MVKVLEVRGAAMCSMNHNILTWNVRGLNEGRKRWKIRNLLSKWKVDIVCLQETKLKLVSNQLVQSLW